MEVKTNSRIVQKILLSIVTDDSEVWLNVADIRQVSVDQKKLTIKIIMKDTTFVISNKTQERYNELLEKIKSLWNQHILSLYPDVEFGLMNILDVYFSGKDICTLTFYEKNLKISILLKDSQSPFEISFNTLEKFMEGKEKLLDYYKSF